MKAWFERDAERYSAERDFWTSHGFTETRVENRLAFSGNIELTAAPRAGEPFRTHKFELTVDYPEGFPYFPPEVTFLAPAIRRQRHQAPDGAPCLFPPGAWHRDQPISQFFRALQSWLLAYVAGSFPRELAIYELPEYFKPSGLTVLTPPGMDEAIAGARTGEFRFTRLLGLDVAVLTHVNGVDVGSVLLDGVIARRPFKQEQRVGAWFQLDHEPQAPHLVSELREILNASGHHSLAFPRANRPRLTALRFVDAVTDTQRWLFVDTGVENPSKPPPPAEHAVLGTNTYLVSRAELFRRLQGVTDTALLAEREVVMFGVGAIGSHVAAALAREGVGELKVCDPDGLRPGNVMRHVLDLTDTGAGKAEAVAAATRRINPFIEVSPQLTGLRNPAMIDELISTANLIISAIGDDEAEELLSEVVVHSPSMPPVLFGRTLHAGDAVRVFLCRPGGACFTCLTLHQADEHPDWVELPPSDLPPVHDAGCATPAFVGAGLASDFAAILLARKAIDLLVSDPPAANHWLWLERPIAGIKAARQPEVGVLRADTFDPHPKCPVCSGA